jgi:predicted nicotinamide N-methyase
MYRSMYHHYLQIPMYISIEHNETPFVVDLGGFSYKIYSPRNRDIKLHERVNGSNPWWAYVWASGIVLAKHLIATFDSPKDILEIGCGLGLSSLVARRLGHRITVTDIMQSARDYVQYNAQSNELMLPHWVDNTGDNDQTYDIVMASDLLYEPPTVKQLIDTMYSKVKSGGKIILADPCRLGVYDILSNKFAYDDIQYTHTLIETDATGDGPTAEDTRFIHLFIVDIP